MNSTPSPKGGRATPGSLPSGAPQLSVVIATYNRPELVRRLLGQLATQSLDPHSFEVVVVDDGSIPPVAPLLEALDLPFHFRCLTQVNAGAGAARHAGVLQARADVLILLDDDMEIPKHFLAAHLAKHQAGESRVVLGHIRPAPAEMGAPLFLRYHAGKIDRLASDFQAGRDQPRGIHLYTGNVSLRRSDYLRAGGLDPELRRSEDVELGVRLEQAGVSFGFSGEAFSIHHSDRGNAPAWRRDSQLYGRVGLRIAHKHPQRRDLHPYRFLADVHPLSLPLLAASLLRPRVGQRLAALGLAGATALERLKLEPAALKAAALVHGLDYFSGVGTEAGGLGTVLTEALRYLGTQGSDSSPELLNYLTMAAADLEKDYAIALRSRQTYSAGAGFPIDLMHRIGLQMMTAYRLMQAFRRAGRLLPAKAISRLIRHLYGADIHWNAELAGGVHIVHGMGIAISGLATVGAGSVLSQQVTLGEGLHPISRTAGAPQVGANVHLGPGATLLGPITIGEGSKVMPGALVMDSVPPGSIVEVAAAVARPRRKHGPAEAERAADPQASQKRSRGKRK